MADDGSLIERLRNGDDTAFEELVEHHAAPLLAVTRRILHDEQEARDAVQETFVAAFRGINNFQSESRVGTWLHRIAVNCALMKLRKREPPPRACAQCRECSGRRRTPPAFPGRRP